MKKTNKVIFTGGHAATTSLFIIDALRKKKSEIDVLWVGSETAIEGSKATTIETKLFPEKNIRVKTITAGRLQRRFTTRTIPSLFKIPISLIQAFGILLKEKPNLIVSLGGFAALPVVVAGWVLRVPIIIHEQTAAVGLANKLSARFAKQILIARASSSKYFPNEKTKLVGQPINPHMLNSKNSKSASLKTIFITGGSRGSQIINESVKGSLDLLTKKYKVLHITGQLDYDK